MLAEPTHLLDGRIEQHLELVEVPFILTRTRFNIAISSFRFVAKYMSWTETSMLWWLNDYWIACLDPSATGCIAFFILSPLPCTRNWKQKEKKYTNLDWYLFEAMGFSEAYNSQGQIMRWSITTHSYIEHNYLNCGITMALMDKFTCVHMNW